MVGGAVFGAGPGMTYDGAVDKSMPRAMRAPTLAPAEVPMMASAAGRLIPARIKEAANPVCQARPTAPPPPRTSALDIAALVEFAITLIGYLLWTRIDQR